MRGGKGTFDVIWHNIENILTIPKDIDFHLDIRCNFRKSTIQSVHSLIDFCASTGLFQDTRLNLYCRPVYYYETKSNDIEPLPQPTGCWCNAEKHFHLIVSSRGEIYACDTLTGEEYALDNVHSCRNVDDIKTLRYDIFSDKRSQKCMQCKLLPVCMGGCMRNRLDSEPQCYWSENDISNALKEYGKTKF